jgi:hypothetical protein
MNVITANKPSRLRSNLANDRACDSVCRAAHCSMDSYVDAPSVIAVGIDPSTFGSSFNDLSPPNPVIRVTQNTPSVQLPIRELKYTHRRTAI